MCSPLCPSRIQEVGTARGNRTFRFRRLAHRLPRQAVRRQHPRSRWHPRPGRPAGHHQSFRLRSGQWRLGRADIFRLERFSDHVADAEGSRPLGHGLAEELLQAAGAAHLPGLLRLLVRRRGHLHGAGQLPGLGPELVSLLLPQQLLRGPDLVRRVAVPPHLVAQHRGTVLPAVARPVPAGPAPS